jgi:hypothetical protein
MEARTLPLRLLILAAAIGSVAAGYRTRNFVVTAPTPQIAQQVGDAAEHYRRELAVEWLGCELPAWYAPCPIQVKVGQIGAGGATTFNFAPDQKGVMQVYGWDMKIQGSLERILDSVLPHEVSHTIFACYFRRPLPRWADEGAATLAEADCEKTRQVMTVKQVLNTRRRIPLRKLVEIKEYPADMQDVLTLYAEGYSVAELLVQQGGKSRYLKFLQDAHLKGWDSAVTAHYGYRGIDDLEKRWKEWVVAGSPDLKPQQNVLVADAAKSAADAQAAPIIRGQSPAGESAEDPFLKHDTIAAAPRSESRPDDLPILRRALVPDERIRPVPVHNNREQVAALHAEQPARSNQPLPRTDLPAAGSDRHIRPVSFSVPRREATWGEFPVEPNAAPAFHFSRPTR